MKDVPIESKITIPHVKIIVTYKLIDHIGIIKNNNKIWTTTKKMHMLPRVWNMLVDTPSSSGNFRSFVWFSHEKIAVSFRLMICFSKKAPKH